MADSLVITRLRGAFVGPVDLEVEPGACAAIVGPSGAGKSLLLRMIADLDPNEGEARLGDCRREAVPAPEWRRRVVHLAAEPGWWATRVDAHLPKGTWPEAAALAERLGLPADCLTRAVATLSTGERQRLALIRALVRRPPCLLLDEPTSALDPNSIDRTEDLLRETLARGAIVVLVSHDATQTKRLGARLHRLAGGRLEAA